MNTGLTPHIHYLSYPRPSTLAKPLPPGLGSGGGFERLHFLLEGFFDGRGEMNAAFAKVGDVYLGGGSQCL